MLRADHIARIASDVKMNLKQGVIVLVISSGPRARPVLKLLARLLPEMYSTRSNYYYLLLSLLRSVFMTFLSLSLSYLQ